MLHTSIVFVAVEPLISNLFKEILPDVQLIDFIDSDVLAQVRQDEDVKPASIERMRHLALAAEAAGVDYIFSSCSSLGPAIDAIRSNIKTPIVKIDEAMADKAAAMGARIGVLATVPTTLAPTTNLILEHARQQGRQVDVTKRLAEGAWDRNAHGDREGHDALVLEGAKDLAKTCDVIVLAQGSMARLAPMLESALGKPVLSSPRLGVEDLKAHLAALDEKASAASIA
jgi:Asp/Glu/hydantoin racemase